MAVLVAKAAGDPSLREAYLDHIVRPLRAQARVFFDRAIERREIASDVDVDVAGADAAAGVLVEDPQPAAAALNARTTTGIVKRR